MESPGASPLDRERREVPPASPSALQSTQQDVVNHAVLAQDSPGAPHPKRGRWDAAPSPGYRRSERVQAASSIYPLDYNREIVWLSPTQWDLTGGLHKAAGCGSGTSASGGKQGGRETVPACEERESMDDILRRKEQSGLQWGDPAPFR